MLRLSSFCSTVCHGMLPQQNCQIKHRTAVINPSTISALLPPKFLPTKACQRDSDTPARQGLERAPQIPEHRHQNRAVHQNFPVNLQTVPCVLQATRAKMTASRTGLPQSLEHRARIAATQRRRRAAQRVLTAVEAFHRSSDTDTSQGGQTLPIRLANK